MNPKLSQPWIQIDRIEALVQLEPALVIFGIALACYLIYKLFLRSVSEERHFNLKRHFFNLLGHLILATSLFGAYWMLEHIAASAEWSTRLIPYVGLFTILSMATVFVKTARIIAFEYLFLKHMREGVPLLLVNLFSLLLSLTIVGWMATEIFGVRLTPLLATSAIFSIVLGLAMQDTLGNLFAGVALQLDKPFGIGDWIEVMSSDQKWSGQVYEVSWRATSLISFTDEIITIPNRTMAQAEISNFSSRHRPIIRSQIYRLPYGSSVPRVKELLIQSLDSVPSLRKSPQPIVLVSETTESWILFKLIYFIDNYGSHFLIADQVNCAVLETLKRNGIRIAMSRLMVTRVEPTAAQSA